MVAAHNGLLRLYAFDSQGNASQKGISLTNELCLSEDGSLVLVSSYDSTALYDTRNLNLKATVLRYLDALQGMAFSTDNQYFALSYGSNYQDNLLNPGGRFEIFSLKGEVLFSSPQYSKESLLGIEFHPSDPDIVLVWGFDFVRVWNWKEGRQIMAPVRQPDIGKAGFSDGGASVSVYSGQNASVYSMQEFSCPVPESRQDSDILATPAEWAAYCTV